MTETMTQIQAQLVDKIIIEANLGEKKFGKYASPHEGLAVIWEEFEELKQEVFKQYALRDNNKLAKEAIQVAASALRLAEYFGALL